ncbi:MAG: murein biosynthesis integral membrane protein MurJ [Mariprofundaceae bacterium]|nr:murein biosynthesis integral membrane protein MurJ [Mariprofundaceae bacterium]
MIHAKRSRSIINSGVKSIDRSNLLRTLTKIASWTMLSRVLGFVRDILLARLLGAGALADAFFVALKLPNFFRRLFAEGTLTVALVPVLTEQRKKSEADAHVYLNALAGVLLLALLVFTVAGIVAMPWLLLLFAPGFHDEPNRWQQSLSLARWMFPYLACISLAAMSWAVLNCYRKFSVAAASPALLNIALIFAAIGLAPNMDNPAEALAIGVVVGGVLQLAIQFPALKRIGWVPSPSWNPRLPALWQTLLLFGPAVIAIAAVQINILVGTILATLQPVGAVSYLYYADRLVQLPLGVFGIAMGTALLPALSEHMANHRIDDARRELGQGLAWLTWITLPAVVGLLLLAEPIVRTLFEHGQFTSADALATAMTLQAYAVGLMAFCWVRVLSIACYANKDGKAPMRYALISVAANIVFALLLMQPLGYVGLALATSLASWLNVFLLWRHFTMTHQQSILASHDLRRMIHAFLASVSMAVFLVGLPLVLVFPEEAKIAQALWVALAVGGGAGVFFGVSLCLT